MTTPQLTIVRSIITCEAAPAQWDAWTDTGQYLYLRFRHCRGRVEQHDSPDYTKWNGWNPVITFEYCDQFHDRVCGYCGVLNIREFCALAGIRYAPRP